MKEILFKITQDGKTLFFKPEYDYNEYYLQEIGLGKENNEWGARADTIGKLVDEVMQDIGKDGCQRLEVILAE